jgi:hypothetical protein
MAGVSVEQLKNRAALCRELARSAADPEIADMLAYLAHDFARRAEQREAGRKARLAGWLQRRRDVLEPLIGGGHGPTIRYQYRD